MRECLTGEQRSSPPLMINRQSSIINSGRLGCAEGLESSKLDNGSHCSRSLIVPAAHLTLGSLVYGWRSLLKSCGSAVRQYCSFGGLSLLGGRGGSIVCRASS